MGLFGDILGAATSAFGAVQQRKGQKEANSTNWDIAQAQMDFQRKMSNTAHQREVKDLRAAGLNPILSATGGPGASTPSGGSAQMQNPNAGFGELGRSTAKTIAEMRIMKSQKNLLRSQKNLVDEQERKTGFETATAFHTAKITQAQAAVEKMLAEIATSPDGRKRAEMANRLAPYKGFGGLGVGVNLSPSQLPKLRKKGKVGFK